MIFFGTLILSYFIGSISTAIVVCQWLALPDPRRHGSQNPGSTNVYRIGGGKAATLTLLGDLLKGFVPVYVASKMGFSLIQIEIIAWATVAGHLWPIFLHFKGGKGVATALGAISAINLILPAILVSVWLIAFFILRYASIASIISSLSAPVASFFVSPELLFTTLVMMALLLFKHRPNVQRLINGTEAKFKKAG